MKQVPLGHRRETLNVSTRFDLHGGLYNATEKDASVSYKGDGSICVDKPGSETTTQRGSVGSGEHLKLLLLPVPPPSHGRMLD